MTAYAKALANVRRMQAEDAAEWDRLAALVQRAEGEHGEARVATLSEAVDLEIDLSGDCKATDRIHRAAVRATGKAYDDWLDEHFGGL